MSKLVKKDELTFSEDQKALIKKTVAVGCTDNELQMFLYQCERTKLDPFSRQIYCIKRKGKMTIQTGIDGFRAIAERTGKYAGNDEYLFDGGKTEYDLLASGEKKPRVATACIKKVVDGVVCDFTASASWDAYCPSSAFMWGKMPFLMLGKCAEALALRKAFPNDLSGVYTQEEMAQDEGGDINAIADKTKDKTKELANNVAEVQEVVAEVQEVVAEVVEDPDVMSLDLEAKIRTALESKYVDDDTRKKVTNWLKNDGLPKESAEECLGKLEKRIEEGKIDEEKNKDEVEYNVDDIPG